MERLYGLLTPLDALRSLVLRSLVPVAGRLYRDRPARITWGALLSIGLAFVLTVRMPVLLFSIGPLLLGVPHLLADLRYLVSRPRLHRQRAAWLVAVPIALSAVSTTAMGMSAALLAALLAPAQHRWWRRRRAIALIASLAVTLAAYRWPRHAAYLVLHLHNLVPLALLSAYGVGRRGARLATLTVAALLLLLLGGAVDGMLIAGGQLRLPGTLSLEQMVAWTAPTAWLAPLPALRLAASFVFLQAVHYGLWIRLIPDAARERPGLRGFRSSARALVADVGPLVATGAMMMTGALLVIALLPGRGGIETARIDYLSIARFHGYLEFAVATWMFTTGRSLDTNAPAA